MAKIQINNPRQIINGGAKKYYFKVKGLGGPKGDKGDKGDTGSRGPQGEPGNAATVYVGSTTTLEVGQDATVENVGTQYNAVLNFGIPQGPRGPQGIQGERGEPGQTGQTGPRGPQGERGTNATVYVGTTTTTNPGTQARVYNSGTDSNAVLNFEIPRGDVGPMPTIAQTTGQSTTEVMSQKATTDALNTKQATISSSNKLSADLVTDTSTTNKFVTAEDKTTWNAKQNALTAGQGIDITSDVISTPALVPEVVASLPAEGAESKLYLTPKAHTTSTATGNPIEATVTEQAGQMESFQLDGDTFQQTYTGKNLFNSAVYVSVLGYNAQRTLGNDGSITWVNTTSDSYFPWVYSDSMFGNSQIRSATIPVQPSTQYTVSLKKTTATAIGLYIYEGDSNYVGIKNTYTAIRGDTSYTFTTSETTRYVILRFAKWASQETDVLSEIQLEAGSTATDYEPFVGGQPSPSPEYPQQIQTVTGEQTVEIVGKNLFDKANANILNNTYLGSTTLGTTSGAKTLYIPCDANTTYTISKISSARFVVGTTTTTPALGVSFDGRISDYTATQITITTNSTAKYLVVFYYFSTADTIDEQSIINSFQIELGSTATAYAPYSKQTLPINLGTIELCKLGTYQDYIWKDGEDWKVHNTIRKTIVNGGETWEAALSSLWGSNAYVCSSIEGFKPWSPTKSDRFIDAELPQAANIQSGYMQMAGFSWVIRIVGVASVAELKTWLSSNNVTLRYVLATATDTVITDTTLITQLEAIRTAALSTGTNTISNTATGSNLAGDMEIGYYGYNPTNRYDKWLWLDLNNNYEQIGG